MPELKRVIKADDIDLQGTVAIGSTQAAIPPKNNPGVVIQPAAQIIQKNEDHVLIQVTCQCGQKTILKCNLAN